VGADERDEELPQPPRHRDRPPAQRLRIELALGALLLLGIALIASAIARRGGGPGGTSTPTPAPTSMPSVPGVVAPSDFVTVAPVKGGWIPRGPAQAARCPAGLHCVTLHEVSARARAAVQDAFPGARITSSQTVLLTVGRHSEGLWGLGIRARTRDAEVIVQVRVSVSGDHRRWATLHRGGQAVARLERALGDYHVAVRVISPADRPPPRAALERLAHDIRLLELS
jgi:hypothetical protein